MNTNINNNIEATNNTMTNEENTTMNNKRTHRRAVKCIETGNTYISIAEAAREMQCHQSNIVRVLKGKQPSAKGMHFEYPWQWQILQRKY